MTTVQGIYLGGESAVFDDCATVGDIMTCVAMVQERFASDVVVLPVGSGEVLPHHVVPPPHVSIVLKKEEAQLSEEECKLSILLHAASEDTPTVVRALAMLEAASPGNECPWETLLTDGGDAEKEKTVRTLVRAGVNGGIPLLRASASGKTGTVQGLIRGGVSVNSTIGRCSESALMLASERGSIEMVRFLVDAGADINGVHHAGWSALMFASSRGHNETVQYLVDARAGINGVARNGRNALMLASKRRHTETVRILVDAGADINGVDQIGDSALMIASFRGYREVEEVLLSAGTV